MCRAMEEMRNKAAEEEKAANIKIVMENLKLSLDQAMEWLRIPASDYDKYRKLITG